MSNFRRCKCNLSYHRSFHRNLSYSLFYTMCLCSIEKIFADVRSVDIENKSMVRTPKWKRMCLLHTQLSTIYPCSNSFNVSLTGIISWLNIEKPFYIRVGCVGIKIQEIIGIFRIGVQTERWFHSEVMILQFKGPRQGRCYNVFLHNQFWSNTIYFKTKIRLFWKSCHPLGYTK